MAERKLSKLEFGSRGALDPARPPSANRGTFPAKRRPAYMTIQSTVYRMEMKNIVRRVKKVGNFHIFAAAV